MQQMNIKGKKVLLRLDLDLPTVDGVVLDNDKIEDSLETIRSVGDHIGHIGQRLCRSYRSKVI